MDCISNSKRSLEDQSVDLPTKRPNLNLNNEKLIDTESNINKSDVNSIMPFETNNVRASETDVGITEYISKTQGFNGTLKERYSDFLVNEIDLQQNVVRLTNLSKPPQPMLPNKLEELLNEDTLLQLEELSCDSKNDSPEIMIEVTSMNKNDRTQIHVGLRQSYNKLESTTVEKEGKKFIIVKKALQKGNRFTPPAGGNYTHFVLYKENRDTIDAINTISSFLRVQPKIFSYAGTKDKRAKTSQSVSAYRLRPEKLLGINKHFQMIKVGNVEFKPQPLNLGDLSGNLFVIIVRKVDGNTEDVEKGMNSLSSNGFINYYGMQRFGTSCIPTHVVGRALLQGDWKHAISLILSPKPEDDEDLTLAKKIWHQTGDAREALNKLKRKSSIEAKLLNGIASNKEKDLVNALNGIPRNMRLMYIHSYQSFIWNKVASKRVQKYGLKVLKGDLILNDSKIEESLIVSKENERKFLLSNKTKFVAEEDLENMKICDVVLPLPGHSVVFPDNETKDWYNEFLVADGMSFENFKSKTKSYSLSGDYRKMIIIPSDVKWELIPYDDNTQPLCLSDLDLLTGNTSTDLPGSGTLKALKVELKLPSSCYATMALREVMKSDFCYKS